MGLAGFKLAQKMPINKIIKDEKNELQTNRKWMVPIKVIPVQKRLSFAFVSNEKLIFRVE